MVAISETARRVEVERFRDTELPPASVSFPSIPITPPVTVNPFNVEWALPSEPANVTTVPSPPALIIVASTVAVSFGSSL